MSQPSPNRAVSYAAPAAIDRVQRIALVVGLLAAAACVAGYFASPEQFFRSYLIGVVYWVSVALGCLGLAMIHHLTGGDWGVVARRLFEAGGRTVPALFLLALPLVFGLESVFSWARPGAMTESHVLEHKAAYLNVPSFLLRGVVYFLIWFGLAAVLSRMSWKQDRTASPALIKRMQAISAPGLIVLAFSASFASFDWLMSLEPSWFSTMYGVYFIGGMGISSLAFLILVGLFLARRDPMSEVLAPRHFHDLGKLMFAFVLLWTYFSISQFLIIWSGNLPEEIGWYIHRFRHGWEWVALALLLFQFGVPFLLLLSRSRKLDPPRLARVAVFLLVIHWLDLYWQVVPTFHPQGVTVSWMDVAAPIAVGGLWLAAFVWQLKRRPLVPINDPYLEEALGHGHGHG